MNTMQTTTVEKFGERVWETTVDLDTVVGIVTQAALQTSDYTVQASPQIVLDSEYILQESVLFPRIREFRHDVDVRNDELSVFIWATDEKRDIPIEEDGERVRKRFPNRFGGVCIGMTIYLLFTQDGLKDAQAEFTVTPFHAQGGSDE